MRRILFEALILFIVVLGFGALMIALSYVAIALNLVPGMRIA